MRYYIEHLPMTIPMGVQSENNAEAVEFDVSDWLARDGSLSFSVWVTRPGETEAYQAANSTLKDGVLYWWPTGADTAIAGEGRVEILAVSANRRMLSGWTATSIRETTTETTTDAPVDQRPWLDQALLASEEAKAAATSAAASADQAEGVVKKEIATLTEDIARNTASPIIPTATGNIVTITDGAARPAVEVISHIEPVQEGSGDPSPDNVRPISGWDVVEVNATGINLLGGTHLAEMLRDKASAGIDAAAGTATYSASAMASEPVLLGGAIKPTTQYTIILYGYSTSRHANIVVEYTDGTTAPLTFAAANTEGYIVTQTSAGKTVAVIRGNYYDGNVTLYYDKCGVFEGVLSADAFVPYRGQTLTADLPETVYGGTRNWTTGVLTVTDKKDTISMASSLYSVSDSIIIGSVSKSDMKTNSRSNGLCDALPSSVTIFGIATPCIVFGVNDAVVYFALPVDRAGTTLETLNAYLSANPLTIVYPLATPYTIQLAPQQLTTLKGTNNVWSDCGDTTLSYIADTKSYIDQKLAAIAAATL